MKRTVMVCLLVTLLAATLAAPADARKSSRNGLTHRAVAAYTNPTLGIASGTGGAACLPCPRFAVDDTDKWAKIVVHDDASPAPVAFGIQQLSRDGTCCDEVAGPFCGSTGRQPIEITPGLDVLVFVFATGDVVCPGAVGTSGTVKAVFSNAP